MRKLVVNVGWLWIPTAVQMRATVQSVVRNNAAALSSRRVSRYWCGDSPNARRNSRLKCAGRQMGGASHVGDGDRLGIPTVGEIASSEQVAGRG